MTLVELKLGRGGGGGVKQRHAADYPYCIVLMLSISTTEPLEQRRYLDEVQVSSEVWQEEVI